MSWPRVICLVLCAMAVRLDAASGHKRNYDAKYTNTNANVQPQWKQRACEKPQKQKANSHYICDDKGDVKCLPGWQGDLCQVPMCRRGCDPMNGYCQRPGECRCRIGYTGELCEKCIPLPGCQHGSCNKPFECICKPGWDGLFCTEPTCRSGCHSTRGYCEAPGECRCRIGWSGRTCSDCAVLPGCQHGTCSKPLECNCLPGYTGLLCQTALCAADCSRQRGYCRKPGECRCKVGWSGATCDTCFPYPGCVNGDCEKPWECNCRAGWGGMLCDEKLTYCDDNPDTCENGGTCVSFAKEDGNFRCQCKQGYLGKNCAIVDEFMLTSTAAPKITPPPPIRFEYEEEPVRPVAADRMWVVSTERTISTTAPEEAAGNKTASNVSATFATATSSNRISGPTANATATTTPMHFKPNEANNDVVNEDDGDNNTLKRRRQGSPIVFPTTAAQPSTASPLTTKLALESASYLLNATSDNRTVVKKQEVAPTGADIIGSATAGATDTANETDNDDDGEEDEADDDEEEEGEGEDYDDDDEEDEDDQIIPNIFQNET